MSLHDTKQKLEFDKILNRIEHYVYSDLGREKCFETEMIFDPDALNTELDKVMQMKEILNASGDLPLDGLKDIRKPVAKVKIEGHFIGPQEFLDILEFLRASRKLKKVIHDLHAGKETGCELIHGVTSNLFTDKILEHNIDITIDENGEVKDSASSALNKIRKQINTQSERLRKTLAGILKKVSESDFAQEEIVTQRDGRFVIPVKVENKKSVQGIIHSSSASGATVFIEPGETINLNNELTELYFEEKREVEKILRELAQQLAVHIDSIKLNIGILSEIDFLQAKARYAIETISCKPVINAGALKLKDAYHPVLLQTHKRNEVVPLNLELGNEFNTLIISGPNAGGKTVVLKTVGLIQLMLQSGILIPASAESEFRLFDDIFVGIGDEQSLENDLSTFSSHLKSIKEFVDKANENSLVLIDEIASGTDPVLGSALSSAILKSLSNANAFTIVTTHNSELKEFAYNTPGIENASLEFDMETLSPNFSFVTGIPGQSFTFEIANKFKFPQSIIDDARGRLDTGESRLEDLLKELNESKQKYSALKNKYDIENARLAGLTNLYDKKLKEITKSERETLYKAKLEAAKILKDANKLIERTIKEVREEKLSPKEVKTEFAEKSAELTRTEEVEEEVAVMPGEIGVNDNVRIKGSDTTGVVMNVSHNVVFVNANGLLIKVKPSELEKVGETAPKESFAGTSTIEINDKPFVREIDLRGKYSDEIENDVEKFLYESAGSGLKEVSIIHGKGSGRLREVVRQILKRTPIVKAFRAGSWNEGDSGVTIVELN